jgi:NADPH:quinone reductase
MSATWRFSWRVLSVHKFFATVLPDKRKIAEDLGPFPIDYRSVSVEEYVSASTQGKGFDIVYDLVGGATLDASFAAVKWYRGHVVSCLECGSLSLAPLSLRGGTYSGVLPFFP